MTADQIITVREGTWNWVYYLCFLVVICFFLLFVTLFLKSLRLLKSRRSMAQVAVKDGKSFAVSFTLWQNFLLWLFMVLANVFLIWISFDDGFNGFTSARIETDKVSLTYLWPMPGKTIPLTEIQKVESKYWGKNSRILVITKLDGTRIKSVSGDTEDIKGLYQDLAKSLGLDPQKSGPKP